MRNSPCTVRHVGRSELRHLCSFTGGGLVVKKIGKFALLCGILGAIACSRQDQRPPDTDKAEREVALIEGKIPPPVAKVVQEGDATVEKFVKSFSKPVEIFASKPVIVNDAQFVVAAQTNWIPGKPQVNHPVTATIPIQLHITNTGMKELVFPTFHTFGIKMLDAAGNEVKSRSAGKPDISTRPISLAASASFSLCRRAELRLIEDSKASELVYYDGTGAIAIVGPLNPGPYRLVFWYSVAPDKKEYEQIRGTAIWVGQAVANEIPVEVLDGTIRDGVSGEPELFASNDVIRIRESKPVTSNGAKFVVAAQQYWKPQPDFKPGKHVKGVPIEIQLRISNVGKDVRIYPTFETFGLTLSTAEGERIMPSGGRMGTIFTRPISLPPNASYTLGREDASHNAYRRAELRWDAKTRTSVLDYYDGTGWEFHYGPLESGRYKLAFYYVSSAQGPFHTSTDPATWIGEAVTEEIVVEVHRP